MTKVIITDYYHDDNYYYLLSNEQVALLKELDNHGLLVEDLCINYITDRDFEFKEVK